MEDLRQIGEEDYKDSEFYAGKMSERKRCIEACKKVIDKFYESNFDPTIDYMEVFMDNI